MRPNLSNILKVLGIPTGGTAGQVLKKTGSGDTDYGWANESGGGGREVPTGGSTGQVLTKTGSGDTDYDWAGIRQVPSGSEEGNVLIKSGSGANQYMWGKPLHRMFYVGASLSVTVGTAKSYNYSALMCKYYTDGGRYFTVSNLYNQIISFLSDSYENDFTFKFYKITVNGNDFSPVILPLSVSKNGSTIYLTGVATLYNVARVRIILWSSSMQVLIENL